MDDRKIFECVAKIPWIRAVQISDMLDIELADVSESLKSLVDAGELQRKPGFAPNGVAAQLYDFTDYFKTTNEYKAVMAAMAPQAATVAAPAPSQAEVVIPKLSDATPTVSKTPVHRAIEHLKACGSASDADLRAVMGLRAGQYPSSYLGTAVKHGLVNKDGKDWKPGPGKPVQPPKPFSVGKGTPLPKPAAVAPAPSATPKPEADPVVAAPPLVPAFRCGLWSDGVIELQRGGRTVIEMTLAESETLADFLKRVPAIVVPT